MRKLLGFLGALAMGALLSSCMAAGRPLITNMGDVGPGETVVVGKVKVTPPLAGDEQTLNAIGSEGYKNRLFLLTGDQWRDLQTPLSGDDYKGHIEAPLGHTFFALSDAQSFYILGGTLILGVSNQWSQEDIYFPGGYKAVIRPGDRAVYIGTIHYYRNEFFQITQVVIEDDYAEAEALFSGRFGGQGPLRKSLLVPVETPSP